MTTIGSTRTGLRSPSKVFAENHDIAACGGRGIAAFEGTKPEWFERISRIRSRWAHRRAASRDRAGRIGCYGVRACQ